MTFIKKIFASTAVTREQVLNAWQSQPHHSESELPFMEKQIGEHKLWVLEELPLYKVKPDPNVGRDHEGSGSTGPIIINKSHQIIDGNQRYYDAQDDGKESIMCYRPKS